MNALEYTFGRADSGKKIDMDQALIHAALNAPDHAACGCYACDEHVQQGHFACSSAPDWALEAEKAGLISRALESGWRWELNQRAYDKAHARWMRQRGPIN